MLIERRVKEKSVSLTLVQKEVD